LLEYLDYFSSIIALLVLLSVHAQAQYMRKNFSEHENSSIKQS